MDLSIQNIPIKREASLIKKKIDMTGPWSELTCGGKTSFIWNYRNKVTKLASYRYSSQHSRCERLTLKRDTFHSFLFKKQRFVTIDANSMTSRFNLSKLQWFKNEDNGIAGIRKEKERLTAVHLILDYALYGNLTILEPCSLLNKINLAQSRVKTHWPLHLYKNYGLKLKHLKGKSGQGKDRNLQS